MPEPICEKIFMCNLKNMAFVSWPLTNFKKSIFDILLTTMTDILIERMDPLSTLDTCKENLPIAPA